MSVIKINTNLWKLDVRVWVKSREFRKQIRFAGSKRDAELEYSSQKQKLKKLAQNKVDRTVRKFSDILALYEKKRGSIHTKANSLFKMLKNDLGNIPIGLLPDRLENYLAVLRNTPLKRTKKPRENASLNRIVAMVRAAFNVALDMEKITKNPISQKRFPKMKETPRDRILSELELKNLMNVLHKDAPHLEPIFKYAIQIPCRKSELINMKREDLDLFSLAIRVHNGTTKTGRGIWKPIPPNMVEYFRNIPSNSEYLFYRNHGKMYLPLGDFKTAWRRALRVAGIQNYRWHDGRHQAASDMLNYGTPPEVVNEIAGWSPGSNMLKTYYNLGGKQSHKFVRFKDETGYINRIDGSRDIVNG